MRKTKIIVTIGPASDSQEGLASLIASGADVFRLNMSHAKEPWVREVVERIRALSTKSGRTIAILMDLQGPAIRTGDLDEPLELAPDDTLEITLGDAQPTVDLSTSANYPGLAEDLSPGDLVLVDNGEIHLRVESSDSERIQCKVLTAGSLGSRRHINLPGVRVRLPGLTETDQKNIELAAECGVDFVALSFARKGEHIEELRKRLGDAGCKAKVVAKIEDQEAVRNLDEIVLASDAVMVARGDLGIEVHIEELPVIQRRIVRKAIKLGRRVIIATHMLESMVDSPAPTRAEVSDVANALHEEADGIMLSGETSIGRYPVRCVNVLTRIAERNEAGGAGFADTIPLKSLKQKIAKSAVGLANSLPGSKIVVFTKRGRTANRVANLRPADAPIYAFTEAPQSARQLCLSRSVTPIVFPFPDDPEVMIDAALAHLKEHGLIEGGEIAVVLSNVAGGQLVADSIRLREIE